ncbi:hypothetical protein AVEN_137868-1 [Araneus ventricosus]|uniref:Uncharacterized protein n=1 Tax=Araneus ventricosus TaxID=182803 RepID=A0A4Y2S8G7_ARAVE|nr:hypothetical protein AVEN_2536-1 [Araneus ventricosus]GBN84502.1 hypothetical protein AVEN_137868-1 [Araneus ventricosus]
MTPCRSNNSTSPSPSPLHSCLAEAPMQSMIWAGEAEQEQGQEEKMKNQLFRAADNVSWLLSFLNRSIYLLLTMPTSYEKEMERLWKLLAEIETDEDQDFGPEVVLE